MQSNRQGQYNKLSAPRDSDNTEINTNIHFTYYCNYDADYYCYDDEEVNNGVATDLH